ncbi:hypothetical protein [Dictyobacter aurantiacus]|uniref:Uncharacterized protein n=1 Tax=Dictyobacter aurantiacus TaxID=1936993 RepID=A0A401ZJR6_9CHLR|nr:hypothetical protein [Dictyobacter aurantiacus]GCE07091.1 hypothetical protein KDAU_44200 [Dictyobacter aurantiacus]
MAFAPGDRIIIDPAYVHSVGQQVKADAQKLMGSEPEGVQDFQNTLTRINNTNFPTQLYSTFYQFINIHTTGFTQLFQDRQHIGDALQDSANATEENEIKTMATFKPTPSTNFDGPEQFPIG